MRGSLRSVSENAGRPQHHPVQGWAHPQAAQAPAFKTGEPLNSSVGCQGDCSGDGSDSWLFEGSLAASTGLDESLAEADALHTPNESQNPFTYEPPACRPRHQARAMVAQWMLLIRLSRRALCPCKRMRTARMNVMPTPCHKCLLHIHYASSMHSPGRNEALVHRTCA